MSAAERMPLPRLAFIGGVAAKLRGRPDSEHEMSFNRLTFAFLIVIYLVVSNARAHAPALIGMAVYMLVAVGVFIHILRHPQGSVTRRLFSLVWDMSFLSYQMHLGDALTSALFPIYLWVIFGNGFRFGSSYLWAAMAAGLAGFGGVVLTTPFWRDNLPLSAGLLAGLVLLPLYAGTLVRKLSRAKQQAEAANEAKTLFLASVSHELRTPLNAIIGMGAMLQETRLDAEQEDMARTVRAAATALLGQINSILDFSRIEAGKMPLQEVDFDLPALLSEVRGLMAAQTRTKGLWFGLHVTPRTPAALHGDERHLREILLNLCGNAVKFTAAGSIVVAVDGEALADGRVRLRCEVADTGIGIAPEARGHIFESFTQADGSILNRFGGTGLGLAICKRLVEGLGGEIGVESEPGRGSTFWFTVTLRGRPVGQPAADAFAGLRVVLLAGADEVGRQKAVRIAAQLSSWGAALSAAASMAQALADLDAAGSGRGLLVIDQPSLSGSADILAQALRRLDPLGRVPLILLGAESPEGSEDPVLRRLFTMILPSAPAPAELAAALRLATAGTIQARPVPLPGPMVTGTKLRVLVADDNRTNQKVIAKILERAGYAVHVVDDGEAALDALEAEEFDIVLMDVNMPRMDGIEATKLYRLTELGGPRRPIIGLTADASPQTAQHCGDAGMDACLIKPVEPQRLLETIIALCPGSAVPAADSAPAAQVTDITRHPQFRLAGAPTLEQQKLDELRSLGGPDFLETLLAGFLEDAEATAHELGTAAAKRDTTGFRTQAHTLCSGAAHVGARRIYDLCLSWRNVTRRELTEQGAEHVGRLAEELSRVRRELARMRQASGRTG